MKHRFLSCYLFVFFLCVVAFSTTNARVLASKQEDEIENNTVIPQQASSPFLENKDSIDELMGIEICENGDEECLKRRIVSEVHLDYIYTQHQKP
ncbi:putative phytosulfokines 6 [Amaranthus tricolor]|uniref:putative phytosulfokines 6 n=1 Tax=Amaranthus tricolor TaxID=29722 RepID=UPI00258D9F09|nr:putative phytosulfokines 6 [Amaranthus tricolor]